MQMKTDSSRKNSKT